MERKLIIINECQIIISSRQSRKRSKMIEGERGTEVGVKNEKKKNNNNKMMNMRVKLLCIVMNGVLKIIYNFLDKFIIF